MSDIAEIGFAADTSDLVNATSNLREMVPAAARVETQIAKLITALNRLSGISDNAAVKAAKGVTANDNLANSYVRLETQLESLNNATGVSNAAATSLGASYSALGARSDALRKRFLPLKQVAIQYRNELRELRAAHRLGVITTDEMAAAQLRLRGSANLAKLSIAQQQASISSFGKISGGNLSNVIAQFQDIGVTAAIGMNPLQIALQQGTQLTLVLSREAEKGNGVFRSLATAFRGLLSPLAIMTVLGVAAAAMFLQFVDWTNLLNGALNGLADILPTIAPFAVLAAAGLALMYSPAILAGAARLPGLMLALSRGILTVTASFFALIGLPATLVLGFVALVAAANVWRDDLTRILGFDIVMSAKNGVNKIIGFFVGFFEGVREMWGILPAVMQDSFNESLNGLIVSFNRFVLKLGKPTLVIKTGFETNGLAGAGFDFLSEKIGEAQGRDYIGGAVKGIQSGASAAADKLRGLALGLSDADTKEAEDRAKKLQSILTSGGNDKQTTQANIDGLRLTSLESSILTEQTKLLNSAKTKGLTLTAAETEQLKMLGIEIGTLKDKLKNEAGFKELNKGAEKSTLALMQQQAQIGLVGRELAILQQQQKAFNDIKSKGITLDAAQTDALMKQAEQIGALTAANDNLAAFTSQQNALKESIINQQTEIDVLNLTAEAAAALRFERKLLNDEMFRGIQLSPDQVTSLKSQDAALVQTTIRQKKLADALDFTRSATKGFLQDLQSGIAKGKNVFETFANSAVNALNRVVNKLLDQALEKFLDGLFSGGTSGLGGGGILGSIGKAFGFAKGGTFGAPEQFARGGAFTNSVVSKPTLFQFAKGGKLGEMGEKGPEAIVPLKRGADGSLGVQMHGGTGNGGSNQRPIANMNFVTNQNISGAVSSQDIVALMKQQGEQQMQETRRGVLAWLQQEQVDGAVA